MHSWKLIMTVLNLFFLSVCVFTYRNAYASCWYVKTHTSRAIMIALFPFKNRGIKKIINRNPDFFTKFIHGKNRCTFLLPSILTLFVFICFRCKSRHMLASLFPQGFHANSNLIFNINIVFVQLTHSTIVDNFFKKIVNKVVYLLRNVYLYSRPI